MGARVGAAVIEEAWTTRDLEPSATERSGPTTRPRELGLALAPGSQSGRREDPDLWRQGEHHSQRAAGETSLPAQVDFGSADPSTSGNAELPPAKKAHEMSSLPDSSVTFPRSSNSVEGLAATCTGEQKHLLQARSGVKPTPAMQAGGALIL